MKKRRIALLVAVLMFRTSMAFAADTTVQMEDEPVLESAYDAGIYFYERAKELQKTSNAVIFTNDDFEKIKEDLYEGFYANKAYNGEEPTLSCIKTQAYKFVSRSEGGVSRVEITTETKYRISEAQYAKYRSKLKTAVQKLKLSGKSDKKKAESIYKYICKNVKYRNTKSADYTAYGALVNGYASCQGISALFYDMCESAGIKCAVIYGRDDKVSAGNVNHAWNIVKLGSQWYNVDATWDLGKKNNFKYFLKSDKYFEKTKQYRGTYYSSKEFVKAHSMCKASAK